MISFSLTQCKIIPPCAFLEVVVASNLAQIINSENKRELVLLGQQIVPNCWSTEKDPYVQPK
jgi:hypothetical protein